MRDGGVEGCVEVGVATDAAGGFVAACDEVFLFLIGWALGAWKLRRRLDVSFIVS